MLESIVKGTMFFRTQRVGKLKNSFKSVRILNSRIKKNRFS